MASKYIIQIEDTKGTQFKIEITIPIPPKVGPHVGSFRCLDKGFLRYNDGATHLVVATIQNNSGDLLFYSSRKAWEAAQDYGMRLQEIHNFVGVDDAGVGKVTQNWVVGIEPGWIKWLVAKVA